MSEDSYDREMPDFTQILAQRLAQKQTDGTPTAAPNGFDPYKAMLDKKKMEDGEPIDTSNTQKWPAADVKALEDFCAKHGILGYNCGRMSPIAALSMLKKQLGFDDRPLEDRVPMGYEKKGTKSAYGPNFPYEAMLTKKKLLNG